MAHSASSSSATRRSSEGVPGVSRVTAAPCRMRPGGWPLWVVVGRAAVEHEADRSGGHNAMAGAVLAGQPWPICELRGARRRSSCPERRREHRRCPGGSATRVRRRSVPTGADPLSGGLTPFGRQLGEVGAEYVGRRGEARPHLSPGVTCRRAVGGRAARSVGGHAVLRGADLVLAYTPLPGVA